MKNIALNKGHIELPDCWADLSHKDLIFVFGRLMQFTSGTISLEVFRIELLYNFSNYRPSGFFRRFLIFRFLRLVRGTERAKEYATRKSNERDTIYYNICRLSREIDFVFTLDSNVLVPNYRFADNPFPYLYDAAPHFERNIAIETNITARQFADAMDLLITYNQQTETSIREFCLNKLVATLYHEDLSQTAKLPVEIKFGIMFWFSGIVYFFQKHDVYSLLFRSSGNSSSLKISLGSTETILSLEKEGYSNAAEMNLITYFDAQIKSLKDSLSKAIASGMTPEQLSAQTALDVYTINSLT